MSFYPDIGKKRKMCIECGNKPAWQISEHMPPDVRCKQCAIEYAIQVDAANRAFTVKQ